MVWAVWLFMSAFVPIMTQVSIVFWHLWSFYVPAFNFAAISTQNTRYEFRKTSHSSKSSWKQLTPFLFLMSPRPLPNNFVLCLAIPTPQGKMGLWGPKGVQHQFCTPRYTRLYIYIYIYGVTIKKTCRWQTVYLLFIATGKPATCRSGGTRGQFYPSHRSR